MLGQMNNFAAPLCAIKLIDAPA
uniref:Uncharacterized protein n=1 Tax=Rhizophora mucronata TaxID=61149 RepID=A0A2P2QHJ5_RHIMU